MMTVKQILKGINNRYYKYLYRRKGFKTNRKIVVIESDDWGSIRMPSKEVYNLCLKNGYRVDNNLYERYDALESEDDLTYLFETLGTFKDINGNCAQFTANTLVANPDFHKIEQNRFRKYYYETIDKTFSFYPKHANCLKLWHQGDNEDIFKIQYHGREHLNVSLFMSHLQQKNENVLWAFNNKMLGSIEKGGNAKNKYVSATKCCSLKDKIDKLRILLDGLKMFKEIHNKNSRSFIAPNYRWNTEYNRDLFKEGVEFLQGTYIQLQTNEKGEEQNIYHYLGQQNEFGQIYLVRNCVFEPSLMPKMDAVDNCLKQIDKAFKFRKPAIIGTHRVNYIGFIDENNRKNNINKLYTLLSVIKKKWPDIEFLCSAQLGEIIRQSSNY